MSFWSRLREAFAPGAPEPTPTPPSPARGGGGEAGGGQGPAMDSVPRQVAADQPDLPRARARFTEAAGKTIEDEDEGWRRLTGNNPSRDLSAVTQDRMQRIALFLWEANPLARAIVEIPLAFLLAEGVKLTCPHAQGQRWLDAFWNDPVNELDLRLVKYARELALFGELCLPVFVNESTGHVRLGYLDPAVIKTVVKDPGNAAMAIGVATVDDERGRHRRFKTIINAAEADVWAGPALRARDSFSDGDCFYIAVNDLTNGKRGRSDLLALADWLDLYDQMLFGSAERARAIRAFLWDVTLTGATPDEVKARAKDVSVPASGGVRLHNEAESWKAESPTLNAADDAEALRVFRNHVLGGAGVPEHWFGGGGDVNRAAAAEMGDPTFKLLAMRQRVLKALLERMGTYVIRQRLAAAGLPDLDPEQPDPNYAVSAEFPELVVRDVTKFTAALQQATAAVALLIGEGLVTEETALRVVALIAERLGLEIDPAEELRQAQEEKRQRQVDEYQTPPDSVIASPEGAKQSSPLDRHGAPEGAPRDDGSQANQNEGA